jgi:hypothetical protein
MPPASDPGAGTYGFQAGSPPVPPVVGDVNYQVCSSTGTEFHLKTGQYVFHASADDNAGNHGQSAEILLTVGYDVGSGASSGKVLAITLGSVAAFSVVVVALGIFIC